MTIACAPKYNVQQLSPRCAISNPTLCAGHKGAGENIDIEMAKQWPSKRHNLLVI